MTDIAEYNILQDAIYPTCNDYSLIKNILFIDDSISDYQTFIDSCNETTFSILYSFNTDRDKLNTFIREHFTQIDRICFVFHGYTTDSESVIKRFINLENYYTDIDLEYNVLSYSNNIMFIKNLITDLNIKNCDYLGCNLLNFDSWQKYFDIIKKDNNVIIGASNDNTGNIKYGGDWVLENTMEDISTIYFTTLIDTYNNLLLTQVVSGVTIQFTIITSNTVSVNYASGTVTAPGSLSIPQTVSGTSYNVVSINPNGSTFAFSNCLNLKSITIPTTVTSIGMFTFYSISVSFSSLTTLSG